MPTLRADEIQTLVIDDKWLSTIAADVQAEVQNIASAFATRLTELAERYAISMPEQLQTVDELTDKVNAHLKKMGFAWK
jgi:type I restriction enzyme M protein